MTDRERERLHADLRAIFDRMEAHFDRVDALLQAILDHLARRQDMPLHQRGFGVMDERDDLKRLDQT